ncbi:MAG TPA: hypothetical protein VEH27_01670 [Methylomirabilota bacterium]|nr:hypothetical protein [Methylomirabilota bacterium]
MGTGEDKTNGQGFKSLRDYILWELNSLGHSPAKSATLEDDSESASSLNRAMRGKLRYLHLSRSTKPA